MGVSGRRMASLVVSALIVASCGSSGGGGQGPPSAPVNVTVGPNAEWWGGTCEGEGEDSRCWVDLSWESAAGPETRFRIYETFTGELGEDESGEGDFPPCRFEDESGETRQARYETAAGVKSIHLEVDGPSIGGGRNCYWVSAVNDAGESAAALAKTSQ